MDAPMVIKPRLFRVDQVSVMIARTVREVYNLIREGELEAHAPHPGRRGLRVTAESVDSFLARHKIPAEKWSE